MRKWVSRKSVWMIAMTIVMFWSPIASAHTKGVSLSRYGLVDISWTGNIVYGNFSEYNEGFNPIKVGDR
ncbi:MAG: hypothetical protein L0Y56_13305, partial [Nitrospira sp.]|nr:hypothetical protein [Nitrospira sp.]